MNVLITGAAGNLGSLLARHFLNETDHQLRLMIHRHQPPVDLLRPDRSQVVMSDLASPETLPPAVQGIDVIVHFAGVLFKANPERFLPTTNTAYFRNLMRAAQTAGVRRIILISFPHVEGPTSFEAPALGRLDRTPISWHAKTRLEEERLLFTTAITEPISLRVGMVYGRGILMVDSARWLARHRLLGVWRQPTPIHLISSLDFCRSCTSAISHANAKGIYHVGDEGKITLQEFLDQTCEHWGYPRPWRMPLGLIYSAARLCELYSSLTGSASPLTRDFIDIGRVPYYGDTTRFRTELLPKLSHPTLKDGIHTL